MSKSILEERSKLGIYWVNNDICSDRNQNQKALSFHGINQYKTDRNQENNPIPVLLTFEFANDTDYCQGYNTA